jgi:excisionase family DNA binding protein
MPKHFTVAEVAEQLGVSRQRIHELCQKHRLGALMLRPRLMVLSFDDLKKLKAVRRKRAGRPPKSETKG